MASTTIAEISRLDLQDLSIPPVASITNVKHLFSYNWIEASTPTIALKKDSGLIYIAQNAARHPDSPLKPLFRSLYITNPLFDIRLIDVVTDRNNIRKLLSFIDPSSTRNGLETFTIHVEVTKNTVIFCREKTATHEFIRPHEFRSFSHEFKKVYTTSQISCNADTRIPSSSSKEPENDSLSSMLGSLSLSPTNGPPNTTPAGSKLTIKEEDQVVPLESTLEIKTRGPQVKDVAAKIRKWEEYNQRDLRKLAALINKILNVVKGCGGNAIIKYNNNRDKLVVRKVNGKRMLLKDLYSKWDDRNNLEAETNTNQILLVTRNRGAPTYNL
ncbi:hypothetical protein K469DRAFT_728751 [Zopfia rhizophila CBS 207.26]|uniref:Uncharacterized protein n=1 Tax=Zopfia rhizophila CBS 207.26 TaxID=1314779 RepID=A0A6A6EUJ7_9PEZI|nr:hypothetical protein K469DRAFT_728751 [Zopfia rhizophila CBS 207.26]